MDTVKCISPAQMEIAWYRMTWGQPQTIRGYQEYLELQAQLFREAQEVAKAEQNGPLDRCPVCRAPRKSREG